MTRTKRPAAAVGAAVLLAFSLTACGGGGASDAPTDASKDEFCKSFEDAFAVIGEGEPTEDEFDKLQDELDELVEVGTPEEIDGDAREGYEIFVDAVQDLDYDDVKDAGDSDDIPGVDADDEKKVEEFFASYGEQCFEVPAVE